MYGRRISLGFGIVGLGAALALAHLGHDALAPVALAVAAFGTVPLFPRELFRVLVKRLSAHAGPFVLYGALARRLATRAGIVLNLIAASISAAGVGILAMLPVGPRLDGRTHRVRLIFA